MEPLAIVVGLGLATAVCGKGAVQRLAWRRLWRWAKQRGLEHKGNVLSGVFGHRHVRLRRESGMLQAKRHHLTVMLQPALDLGLMIRPAHQAPLIGVPEVETAEVHSMWARVQALDPKRCAPLLQGEVTDWLHWFYAPERQSAGSLQVFDDRVVLALSGDLNPERLQEELERAIALADAIDERRAMVPPSAGLEEAADSWRAAALKHQLTLSCTPLSLIGQMHGQRTWAVAVRMGEGYGLDVLVWFGQPLDVEINIKSRQEDRDSHESWADAFEVERGDVSELLDASLRQTLLDHHRDGVVVNLDERSLWLRFAELPDSGRQVAETTEEAAWLGREIAMRAASLRKQGGLPYRRMAPA